MNVYKQLSGDALAEHLKGFLVNSWSYSKVSSFSRNEKAFEKEEIYGERGRSSVSSIAGRAYHAAMEEYFNHFADAQRPDLVRMQSVAFDYIDGIPADEWKIQKTTPTIEQCIIKANETASFLIGNFMAEAGIITRDIAEVLGVERRCEEWLSVNGVDIPLPCHAYIDLIVRTKDGRTVIVDHKSKAAFTDPKEIALMRGKQAIAYVLCYESATGGNVDEVWFVENKATANRDKSPQLRLDRLIMDKDSRALYEAMLYEPLRRMIQAVSDPDYVYTCNDADNFCDKAELYDFWARTMIAEADDFPNVPKDKKELIRQRQRKIKDSSLASISPKTITSFRKNAEAFIPFDIANDTDMSNGEKIEHVLRTFGKISRVAHTLEGYSSDTYLLEVSAGIKIGDLARYRMDIANALNLPSVRIASSLVVYEGTSYLPIEAAKRNTRVLPWDINALKFRRLPIGRDNYGNDVVWDLDNHSTPHVLICGATGSGKSVCIRSTIEYAKAAGVTDIVIFDPKYEFDDIEGALVYSEIGDIEDMMSGLVEEMHMRARRKERRLTLVVFDEFADAVSAARSGKELNIYDIDPDGKRICIGREKSLEDNLKILAQKGRSLGFRIVAATQRASTKIITGDTKVNFPVQICFRMPKAIDSKVVLDEEGAETLQGYGDGLIRSPEYLGLVRFQGYFKK